MGPHLGSCWFKIDTQLCCYPQPNARDDALRASWGCTPKPLDMPSTLSRSEAEEYALVQMASKLGIQIPRSSSKRLSFRNAPPTSNSPDDESFIRTPPTGPLLPSTPEMSPPPSYDSLAGVPDLPGGSFALPPPALSPSTSSKGDTTTQRQPTPPPAASSQPSKTVILYVGRISWEKNIRLLIEAFRMLPTPVRDSAKLVFVGDGPARGDLTRLCKKYGLDATFMGHQKGKRLGAMYASSSVFAFPSFTETFGQVVLEALASGLPVVGLHAEGTSDLVSHGSTGLLLDVKAAAGGSNAQSTTSSPSSSPQRCRQLSAKEDAPPLSPRLNALRGNSMRQSSTSPVAAMTNFVEAASAATAIIRPAIDRRNSSASNIHDAQIASTSNSGTSSTGLASPIPSVLDFAACMSSQNSAAFVSCARSYSMLLERLIRDRPLRAAMGQRAQIVAARRTWWDAMDAVVRGYETVVATHGVANLSDDELEALRREQQKTAPLTGWRIKTAVLVYTLMVAYLCWSLCANNLV